VRGATLVSLLSVAPIGATFGCGGSSADAGRGGSLDGGSITLGDASAAAGALGVDASSTSSTSCPGECVTLVAHAHGGVPPYSYAWDHGLPAASVATVCPLATTTYPVSVADSAGTGEVRYPGDTATASVTVNVAPAACDAGGPDAGVDSGAVEDANASPTRSTGVVCSAVWAQQGAIYVSPIQTVVDGAGNAYVAVDYVSYGGAPYPELVLGDASPVYPVGFAVAKIDPTCQLQWVREFGPTDPSTSAAAAAVFTSIAVDGSGAVTVLGAFDGVNDLGSGSVGSSNTTITEGFLLRLDTDGNPAFSKTFVPNHPNAMTPFDVAVTPQGVSTVAVNSGPEVDFGGGGDIAGVLAGDTTRYYLVQFDATGAFLWQESVSSISSAVDEILDVATNSTGEIWASGSSQVASGLQPVVLGLGSTGALTFLRDVSGASALAAGDAGAVTLDISASDSSETFTAYGADGSSPWTHVVTAMAVDAGGGWSSGDGTQMAIDPTGNLVYGGTITGAVSIASSPIMTSVGLADVAYQAFDPTGRLVSVGSWGGPDDDELGGVGVDPSGNVILTGVTTLTGTSATERIFLVKLGR
jgi:hypothetical protein